MAAAGLSPVPWTTGQPCGSRGLDRDLPHDGPCGDHLREDLLGKSQDLAGPGVPLPRPQVEERRGGGLAEVGRARAAQAQHDPVGADQEGPGGREGLGLLLREPGEARGGAPGRDDTGQLVEPRGLVGGPHARHEPGRAHVVPHDGRPDAPPVGPHEDGRVHLASHGHGHDVRGVGRGLPEQLAAGLAGGGPPELGVDLLPAGLGAARRVVARRGGQDPPLPVHEGELDRRGPEVDAQRARHATHRTSRGPCRCRGGWPCPWRPGSRCSPRYPRSRAWGR